MSNLKTGDRVRHNLCRAKGKIVSSLFAPRRFIIVKLENGGKCATWRIHDVKPIVTVRG